MSELQKSTIDYCCAETAAAYNGRLIMPTEVDRKRAWGNQFVIAAVMLGVLDAGHAEELFQAGIDEWDYDMTPGAALNEEMSYWSDDGDEA